MIAADLREVEEPDVALVQPLGGDPLEELLDRERHHAHVDGNVPPLGDEAPVGVGQRRGEVARFLEQRRARRSEEHTSELQSQSNLVCRLLLDTKYRKADAQDLATLR